MIKLKLILKEIVDDDLTLTKIEEEQCLNLLQRKVIPEVVSEWFGDPKSDECYPEYLKRAQQNLKKITHILNKRIYKTSVQPDDNILFFIQKDFDVGIGWKNDYDYPKIGIYIGYIKPTYEDSGRKTTWEQKSWNIRDIIKNDWKI